MDDRIWFKSYVKGVPTSIDFKENTTPEFLEISAERFGKRIALNLMGKKISYKELNEMCNRFANALIDIGVKKGDRVALMLPNLPQMVIGYYGTWRAGAVPVPNNPLYTDRELEYQFNDCGAEYLVTLDLLAPRMLALRPKTKIKAIITAHINDYLPFPIKQLYPILKKGMYCKYEKAPDYYQFLDLMKASPKPTGIKNSLDDLALIPYTGGTTGPSKGVMLTHRNISCVTQMAQSWFFDFIEQEMMELATFPFFHMAGFNAVMTLAIINGWTMVLVPRPAPQSVFDLMVKYKTEIVPAVPTVYVGLLDMPEFHKQDLSFVTGFFSGAAPLALETINGLREATGASIVEAYGMTESSTFISVTPWRGTLKPGSVGVPIPECDVRIVDIETGKKEMPVGEEGELIFTGPHRLKGYYNRPEETKNSIRDGWFYTGDIAKMDEDGYIYIVDRKKDMIIAGGYNIYPRDIDEVLFEHPKIVEACAVGVPHEYRGETVKAFVVVKEGETLTEEELDKYCREKLAAYKVPKLYEFLDSLPKSAVGKILRRELRDIEVKKKGK